MKETKVAFFFPDRNLGGGPFYLIRLASFLSKSPEYKIFYIDYADGFSHQIDEVDKTKITFIEYTDYSDKIVIKEPVILFAPIYYLHNMPMINKKSKVLFFNWHNLCLPVLKNNLGISDKKLHYFLKLVHKHNGEVFCDGAHYLAHNEIAKLNFPPSFVPIIVDKKKLKCQKIIKSTEINVAVLGRLVVDKIQSINNLIFNFEKLNFDKNINIHVIGSGPAQADIQSPTCNNIHLIFSGILRKEKLDTYLAEKIDILFAMGTSILEGAALGIPSVVVSTDLEPYFTDKFVWLYDTKNYCLGWNSYQIKDCSEKYYSLKEIITQIYEENQKETIGKKCYDFCQENFSYDFSVKQLKKYLSKTSLTFDEVCRCKRKIMKANSLYENIVLFLRKLRNKFFLNVVRAEFKKQETILKSLQNQMETRLSENLKKILYSQKTASSYQIQLYTKVALLHPSIFLKYKNINRGKSVVIIASGPTVKYYIPIENAINIALNGSFSFNKVDFDYYFATDFAAIHESINEIPNAKNLKNAKKFYGFFEPVPNSMIIPEQFCIRDNAERYVSHSLCYDSNSGTYLPYINFSLELSAEPLVSHGTIAHEAFQFALYTNPEKIYLVGCDCTTKGHFFDYKEQHKAKESESEVLIFGWKKLAEFAKWHYPETEIISINPIGLKSVFKDVYTDSFLRNEMKEI